MQREGIIKWAVGLFLLFFVLYAVFESYNFFLGPRITVITPVDGATFDSSVVTIIGSAKNVSFITLDDRQIFVDKTGKFEEKLALVPGYNIMSIKATDRFGKKIEKKMQFYLDMQVMSVASSTLEVSTSTKSTATSTLKIKTTASTTEPTSTSALH